MAQAQLAVTAREKTGKGFARRLRGQGLIPGVVYGKGMEPCPVTVEIRELQRAIATESGWNTLMTLQGEGAFAGKVVILKDMQVDSLKRTPCHVDLQAVDMGMKVHVMVPVHALGKSVGEKNGGQLEVIRKELEVVCLPGRIPSAIEIDVTALNIGDVIHVEDLKLEAGLEVPHEVNFTVITCTGHKEEAPAAEEAEG